MNNAVFGKCLNVASRQRNKKKHRLGCLQGFAQENCTTVLRKDRTSQSHMSHLRVSSPHQEMKYAYTRLSISSLRVRLNTNCALRKRAHQRRISRLEPAKLLIKWIQIFNIELWTVQLQVLPPNAGPTCWAWCLHDEAVFKPFQKSLTNSPFTLRHWL